MQLLKQFFKYIAIGLAAINFAHANYLNLYYKKVKEHCPNVNTLALKKTLIAFSHADEHDCENVFALKVVESCDRKVTCEELHQWLNEAKNTARGNVVGEH